MDEKDKNKATPPSLEDQAAVGLNEGSVKELARVFGSMAAEEMANIFGNELGAKIEKARKEVDRSKVAGMTAQPTKREPLNHEQMAEWLRCALMRSSGRFDLGKPREDLDEDGRITQALNPVTGSSGAYLLPDEFVSELEKRAPTPVVLWPLVNKAQVKSRTVKMPSVTTYLTVNTGSSANVNSATTGTEITETVPVFSEIEWNLEDSDSRLPIKLDLLEESPINVYEELLNMVADDFARNRESMILNGQGHGHSEPEGLLMGVSGISTVAISAAPTVANILDLCAQVPARYRANATMVTDAQTGFAVASALSQNIRAPQYLLGKLPKMVESEHMPEGKILVGDLNYYGKILVGDLNYYRVKYIRLLQVVSSIAAERKTREVVVTETWTGKATQTDAFRIGTGVTY